MMKIAIIVTSLERKGPVFVAANIANNIVSEKVFVNLLYFKESDSKVFIDKRVNVRKINVKDVINFSDYDVVHSHSFLPDMLVGFVSLFSCKKKYKTLTTIHNKLYDDVKLEYGFLKRWVLLLLWPLSWRFFDSIACITKSSRDYYVEHSSWYKRKKINVVYNGVDDCYLSDSKTEKIESLSDIKAEGKVILGTCAVLTKRKGILTAVEALKYLDDKYVLVIVGDGPEKDNLLRKAELNSVLNRVIFFGKTQNPIKYMNYFDVYVMPSISEGFGLAAIEAACLGKDIITTNIDTFKEIFIGCQDVFFEVSNPKSLADKVVMLEPGKANLLKESYRENYSCRKMAQGYKEIYHGLKKI